MAQQLLHDADIGTGLQEVRGKTGAQGVDWHLLDQPEHQGVQRLVRDLNRLYRNTPALYEQDFVPAGFEWIDHQDAPITLAPLATVLLELVDRS